MHFVVTAFTWVELVLATEAVWKRLADHASKIKITAPVLSEVTHEAIH